MGRGGRLRRRRLDGHRRRVPGVHRPPRSDVPADQRPRRRASTSASASPPSRRSSSSTMPVEVQTLFGAVDEETLDASLSTAHRLTDVSRPGRSRRTRRATSSSVTVYQLRPSRHSGLLHLEGRSISSTSPDSEQRPGSTGRRPPRGDELVVGQRVVLAAPADLGHPALREAQVPGHERRRRSRRRRRAPGSSRCRRAASNSPPALVARILHRGRYRALARLALVAHDRRRRRRPSSGSSKSSASGMAMSSPSSVPARSMICSWRSSISSRDSARTNASTCSAPVAIGLRNHWPSTWSTIRPGFS